MDLVTQIWQAQKGDVILIKFSDDRVNWYAISGNMTMFFKGWIFVSKDKRLKDDVFKKTNQC